MPTISVIIPAYNAAATIHETITSVLAQTFTDFELLVINDGSTDDTLSVIQQFSDPRLQVISYDNAGPQKSRNRGLARAAGQYVAFLDADDLWTPDKLAEQLQALQEHPTAAVAYSWTDIIDQHSQWVGVGRRSQATGAVFSPLLLDNFLGSGSNPLIKTAAIRAVGGFDEAILAGQDWDMWLTLAAQFEFAVVPKVQILYRKARQARSWSSNFRRQEAGLTQVMNKHLQRQDQASCRRRCFSMCYRYLLFECFEKGQPSFYHGRLALAYFIKAIYLEPQWWLQRRRLIGVVLWKVLAYCSPLPWPAPLSLSWNKKAQG